MKMTISDKQVVDHLMEEELARRHAAFHIHLGVLTNTPGMTTWYGANLGNAATIHDLNGQPIRQKRNKPRARDFSKIPQIG